MAGIQIRKALQRFYNVGSQNPWKAGYLNPRTSFIYSRHHLFHSRRTSVDTKDVTIRQARAEDYKAVLDITPDIYTGADYMPLMYHSFLSNPKAHPYLLEKDEQVVAFYNCLVLDNGRVVASTGGRCRPEVRGQGLGAIAKEASLAAAQKRYPRLKILANAAVESKFHQKIRDHYDENGAHIVLERSNLQYVSTSECHMELLSYLKPEVQSGLVLPLNGKNISKQTIDKSFSEGHFIWGSNKLPAVANNYNIMQAMAICKVGGSLDTSSRLDDVYNTISIGAFMTTPRCHMLDVSINGNFTFLYALRHICYQLNEQAHHFKQKNTAVLELNFTKGSPGVDLALKEVLQHFLGDPIKSEDFPTETLLVIHRPLIEI